MIFVCEPCGVSCFSDAEPSVDNPICHTCDQEMVNEDDL